MDTMARKICLIGGTGRSGTTILKQIFSKHPAVASIKGRELRFPIDPDGLVDFCSTFESNWSPYLWDYKLKRLKKTLQKVSMNNPALNIYSYLIKKYAPSLSNLVLTPKYSGLNGSRFAPNMNKLIDQLIDELTQFEYNGYWIGSSLFEQKKMLFSKIPQNQLYEIMGKFWYNVINDICIHQGNKSTFVEDNTLAILYFDSILKLVQDAKLVHIYRDPRDVIASYVHMRWAPHNIEHAAYWYKGIMRDWIIKKEDLPNDSYIEIKFEDLISDPYTNLNSICDFWSLKWSKNLLDTKLNQSNAGRWLTEFNTDEKKIVNTILRDEITYFGYSK